MENAVKRIGVLTSGGDAPGMNAAIRAVVRTCLYRGIECVGIRRGYNGLINGDIMRMDTSSVTHIINRGGTILYTARSEEFRTPEGQKRAADTCRFLGLDGIVAIGGDGTFRGAEALSKHGISVVGIPATIDNDIVCTDYTLGFDTASNTAVDAIDRLRDTMQSHERCSVVEVMGRNAGWLTGATALAKGEDCEGIDLIYLPEVSFDVEKFVAKVGELFEQKKSVVIAVSEGVTTKDGRYVFELGEHTEYVDAFGHKLLSGTAKYLASLLSAKYGCKTRAIELSSLQRCAGHMTSRVDVTEAYQVGGSAVKAAFEGDTGKMITLDRVSNDPYICTTGLYDIHKIANIEKKVPLEWIINDGTYVSQEMINYIKPLVQAELTPIMINGQPRHIVMGM